MDFGKWIGYNKLYNFLSKCAIIKQELKKKRIALSRKKIGEITKDYNLISNYTIKNFKVHHSKVHEANVENIVDRQFKARDDLDVLVSDLTYVRVGDKWQL